MSKWIRHTGTERPAELAAAQIVEWLINGEPTLCTPLASLNWDAKPPGETAMYYRPTADSDGLPYVSAVGLEPWAEYVATDPDGSVCQFEHIPEKLTDHDDPWEWYWDVSKEYSKWLSALDPHAVPGPPEKSLARVWRD